MSLRHLGALHRLHLGPRHLRSRPNCSAAMITTWEILPGCRAAQHVATAILHDLLHHTKRRVWPQSP
eukprot:3197346-Pyramimonas_sp.AAC.1